MEDYALLMSKGKFYLIRRESNGYFRIVAEFDDPVEAKAFYTVFFQAEEMQAVVKSTEANNAQQ